MSLIINTNIASLSAQRNLDNNHNMLGVSVQRLSSGLRINSAKDDAAGLSISEKLKSHVRSISVAIRNSQDGISLAQTAEGGLSGIGNILARMRELAEQSSNGSIGANERSALDNEYAQLIAEIDRISSVTEFNGTKLIDGSTSTAGITLQVGFQNTTNDRITFFSGVAATSTSTLGVTGIFGTVSAAGNAQSALSVIDAAITTIAIRRGTLGAIQSRLDSTISNLSISSENLTAATSRITDADFAYETTQFTRNQILVQAGTAILAQANSLPQSVLALLK